MRLELAKSQSLPGSYFKGSEGWPGWAHHDEGDLTMGIVENYKLGEILCETTAGTNGNVNPFILPGGMRFWSAVWRN
jgi:hypothetical protein